MHRTIKTIEIMTNFISTSTKVVVEDYPYGFKLRTTLYHSIEFFPKKGYRIVTQTVNPKTGRVNAPKKSTYDNLIVRYYDENNHIKMLHFSLNGREQINKTSKFISENFDLFAPEEIEYLYMQFLVMIKVDMKATVVYGGSNFEELKPLYDMAIKTCVEGIKNKENLFNLINLDVEKIEATKPKNFSPFN